MVRETQLSVNDLIMPLFVHEKRQKRIPIKSMPGIYQVSITEAVTEAKIVQQLGIPAVMLFGIPNKKDSIGTSAWVQSGVIQKAVIAIKKSVKDLIVITDTCLCEYTAHGHCGPLRQGEVDNDRTLELLGKTAVSQARAGADMVAPSGMMDGMVRAIRTALDKNGLQDRAIMSYAVKYASAFYGPFREAAGSSDNFKGDRKSHQMDPANTNEALLESLLDIEEGADILMVKPALPCLDIIRRVKGEYPLPLAAYNVSGEYAMLVNAVKQGLLDSQVILETLVSIKRAGADMIITYFAKEMAKEL
jgi:porphobilinogen synthase